MGVKNTYICINCNVEVTKVNTRGKFCCHSCQQEYNWNTVIKPKLLNGEKAGRKTYRRLVIETYGEICSSCGLGNVWNGKSITLQVDHIDGNSDNNKISNLRMLCPNCHSQTETYGAKGSGNKVRKDTTRNKYLREYKNAGLE